jgi:HlyD family secretion protein
MKEGGLVRKRAWIVVAVLLAAGLAAGFTVGRLGHGKSDDEAPAVRMELPERGDLVESVNAPGEVEPRNKVAISARVMARIIELPYDEGAPVTAGNPDADPPVPPSVLVRLDATDLKAALRSAEARRSAQSAQIEVERAHIASQQAQLEGSRASLVDAEGDLKRSKALYQVNTMSESDRDDAQLRCDELRAQVLGAEHSVAAAEAGLTVLQYNLEAADAEIERARDAVGYTTITSPIDGVVTRRNAKVGELVVTGTMNNPGTVIMEVADLSQMLLVVQVDEADIGGVEVGQQAVCRIHAYPDREFKGVVDSIALTHDFGREGNKYFKTKILLAAEERAIHSGLSADVDIQTRTHTDVLKVPSQAVLGRPVDNLPLAIRENNPDIDVRKAIATVVYRFIKGKAVVTPVTVGASDATHTVIRSGVTPEDRIIVGPYKALESLQHDQKVRDEREVEKTKASEEKKQAAQGKAKSGEAAAD